MQAYHVTGGRRASNRSARHAGIESASARTTCACAFTPCPELPRPDGRGRHLPEGQRRARHPRLRHGWRGRRRGRARHAFPRGDRVMGAFMPDWVDGEPTPAKTALAPGAATDGAGRGSRLCRTRAGRHAGGSVGRRGRDLALRGGDRVNALFVGGRAQAGQTALLLGTGGVSIWGCSWPRPPACGPSSPRPATASWNRRANWARMC